MTSNSPGGGGSPVRIVSTTSPGRKSARSGFGGYTNNGSDGRVSAGNRS